jgi:hypothetical protein
MIRSRLSSLLVLTLCFWSVLLHSATPSGNQIAGERRPFRSIANSALEAAFQRVLYASEPEGGGFRAVNPAQRLVARFTVAGAFVEGSDALRYSDPIISRDASCMSVTIC